MPKQKAVTVILSCYGADKLIEGYVDSMLANSYLAHLHVLVVNIKPSHQDPSFVEAQIRRLGKAVTLINLERNITLYEAWNLGVQKATTEFVSNLNLDDRVDSEYYEIGIRHLREQQADIFSSNSITTNQIGNWAGTTRKEYHLPEARFGAELISSYGVADLVYLDNELSIKKNSVPHCCPIWRRSLHEKYEFFDCHRFDFCADFAFWLKVAAGGARLIHHKDFLTLFYMGAGTVSDRLIHGESQLIVDKWTPAFESQYRKTSELGRNHDLLHFAFNHEVIFSARKFHEHLKSRVSLCTAAHKVDTYFLKALRSVLAQSYQNFELVVVLDGVQDEKQLADVRSATENDLRVKLIVTPEKLERSNCRNMAMASAVGEWIMVMDSDDLLDKNAFRNLLRASLEFPKKIWFGNEVLIDEQDQRIQDINYGKNYDLTTIMCSWPSHANILWPANIIKGVRYPASYVDPDLSGEHLAGEDVEFIVSVLQGSPTLILENCGAQTYYWRRHLSFSYRRRHVSIFAVLRRLIRLFHDCLGDDKFCTKLAERFFDCFVWFSIDTVARGGVDGQFLADYTEALFNAQQQKILEKFRSLVTDERIERVIRDQFAVNQFILVGIDQSVVQSAARQAFYKLVDTSRTGMDALKPNPSIAVLDRSPKNHHPTQPMNPDYQRINRFRNCHQGQECILMCNGPSLRKIDFGRIDRDRFVLFGLNKIFLAEDFLGTMPRYVAAVNAKVIEQSATQYATLRAIKFLSNRVFPSELKEDPFTYFINTKFNPVPEPRFSLDVGAFVSEGWTVTHVALQIIYHMGFRKVYVVGLDHRFSLGIKGKENTEGVIEGNDPDHFHPKYFGGGQKWDLPDLVNSEISYRAALDVFNKAGRSIINCTPDTACDIFPIESHEQLYR